MKKKLKLKPSEIIVLKTIKQLNDLSYFPLPEGIYKIISGIVDEETKPFMKFDTFGTLLSFNAKKITFLVKRMMKKNFLNTIFDNETKTLYYRLSFLGEEAINLYKNKKIVQKNKKSKPTIVKID